MQLSCKNDMATLLAILAKIGQLFIQSSGHTDPSSEGGKDNLLKNRDRMWQWFQAQLQGGRFQHQRTAVRIQSLVKLYAQHVYSVNCRKYRYRKYDDKEREARNGNFSHKNRNHTQRTEISMLRKYISFQLCKGFSYLGLEVSNTNLCSNEDKFEFQP